MKLFYKKVIWHKVKQTRIIKRIKIHKTYKKLIKTIIMVTLMVIIQVHYFREIFHLLYESNQKMIILINLEI